jgi:hypothetical protein
VDERAFAYSIDAKDRVVALSDAWLEFARENRASELTRERVIGQPLWSFVSGRETRRLYEDVFVRARSRRESIELPFRCDSPDRFRFMRLLVSPGSGEGIECVGVLIREQQRPFFPILDRAFPRTSVSLPMCSLCKRIYAFRTRWLELEDAIRELDLFGQKELPRIDYVVCDGCVPPNRLTQGGAAA